MQNVRPRSDSTVQYSRCNPWDRVTLVSQRSLSRFAHKDAWLLQQGRGARLPCQNSPSQRCPPVHAPCGAGEEVRRKAVGIVGDLAHLPLAARVAQVLQDLRQRAAAAAVTHGSAICLLARGASNVCGWRQGPNHLQSV